MATPKQPVLDFNVLERKLRPEDMGDRVFAASLGTTPCSLRKYRAKGIGLYRADKMCCHLGIHPISIWGDDYFVGIPVVRLSER